MNFGAVLYLALDSNWFRWDVVFICFSRWLKIFWWSEINRYNFYEINNIDKRNVNHHCQTQFSFERIIEESNGFWIISSIIIDGGLKFSDFDTKSNIFHSSVAFRISVVVFIFLFHLIAMKCNVCLMFWCTSVSIIRYVTDSHASE